MSCIQKYFQLPPDAFYAVHPQDGKWFWIYEGGGIKSIVNSDFNEIYSQLIKNISFRMQYATRCGDILNSFLSSKAVFEKYTQYGKMLSSEFEFERIRWSNTPPWDIITKYQVDAITQSESRVRREIMKELHIPDIVNIKIQTEPVNNGTVYVNGTKILCADEIDNCQNVYFVDTELSFQPIPKQGYIFSQWDVVTGDGTSDTLSSNTFNLTPTTQYTVTARFSPDLTPGQEPSPGDIQINEYWIDDNGTRYSSVGYRAIAGDWIELLVDKPGRMDIRGWRITDNDTKNGSDEGSIILPEIEKLASLPKGTIILLITTKSPLNDENFPSDDLSVSDKQLIFYVGNGNLDVSTDPGFDINPDNDNVVLLAPGLRNEFSDDNVIDFIAEGLAVTANSFGALKYGVAFDHGFSRLGIDDGALLTIRGSNDFSDDWIVDPDNCSSGDAICANARNMVTPGRINPGQSPLR